MITPHVSHSIPLGLVNRMRSEFVLKTSEH
jgi:hypothetical protein